MSKLVTPEFRGSFVHILEPHAIKGVENAKARYQITIPLPKKDGFWTKLNALVEETAKAKWGKIPPKMKSPVKDGDEEERRNVFSKYYIIYFINNFEIICFFSV